MVGGFSTDFSNEENIQYLISTETHPFEKSNNKYVTAYKLIEEESR